MRSGLILHNIELAAGLKTSHSERIYTPPFYYNIFFNKNQVSIFIWG